MSDRKKDIIEAGKKSIQELIKVANQGIDFEEAGEIKNAVATRKMAIFDALEIDAKITEVEESLNIDGKPKRTNFKSAEERV